MKNKKSKDKTLKLQGTRKSRNRERASKTSPFDMDSFSEYPWWGKLFIKIFLTHENKYIDKILDIGCLLWLFMLMGIIIYIAIWILNFQENFIY
jgi:hypothetical protein